MKNMTDQSEIVPLGIIDPGNPDGSIDGLIKQLDTSLMGVVAATFVKKPELKAEWEAKLTLQARAIKKLLQDTVQSRPDKIDPDKLKDWLVKLDDLDARIKLLQLDTGPWNELKEELEQTLAQVVQLQNPNDASARLALDELYNREVVGQ